MSRGRGLGGLLALPVGEQVAAGRRSGVESFAHHSQIPQAVGSPAVPSQPAVESPAAPNQQALALPEENGEAQPSLTNTQDPLAVGIPGLQPANKLSVLDRERMRKEPEKRLPSVVITPANLPSLAYLQSVWSQRREGHWEVTRRRCSFAGARLCSPAATCWTS